MKSVLVEADGIGSIVLVVLDQVCESILYYRSAYAEVFVRLLIVLSYDQDVHLRW